MMRDQRGRLGMARAWLALALAFALTARASADCADVPNLAAELPREQITQNQKHLVFSYDIDANAYSVSVRRGASSRL